MSIFRFCLILASILSRSLLIAGLNQEADLQEQLKGTQQLIIDGKLSEAHKKLEELARTYSQDPRVHNLLGVIQAQAGDYKSAESSLVKAIDLYPRYTGALLNLGRLYQENLGGDPFAREKGIAIYTRLLSYEPGNTEANFQIAVLLHLGQDFTGSQDHLSKLPAEDRARAMAKVVICANHAALGHADKADELARELATDQTLVEQDVLLVLPALRAVGRDDLALQLLESLANRDALTIPTVEKLAFLYASLDDSMRARAHLESLANRHPNLPDLLIKLAWISFNEGDYEKTLSYLAHARDLDPSDGNIHLLFGIACVELNLGVEAVISFEKAVNLEPGNAYYNYAMGAAVLHWKEPAEAIPYFEKYLQVLPGDPRGEAALAQARFLNKEYELAGEGFQKVVSAPELAPLAHFYLGTIAKLDLRQEEAISHLSKALELRPDYPDALAELGGVLTRQKEYGRAAELLNRALVLDPDHYMANFNLLTLYSRTRDERYAAQKEAFDELKDEQWAQLSESLRTIEVVPRNVFHGQEARQVATEDE